MGGRRPLDWRTGTGCPPAAPARALGPWMRAATVQAAVEISAPCWCQPTGSGIMTPAGFNWRLTPRGRWTAGSRTSIIGSLGEPPKPWPVRVTRTGLRDMVLLQTIRASGNRPGPPRKRLVVEAGVRDRPIQVFLCQRLPAVTAVIGHPPSVIKVALRPEDGSQVGKKLRGLFREPGGHRTELLCPHRDVLDGGPRWQGGVVRSMRRDVVN